MKKRFSKVGRRRSRSLSEFKTEEICHTIPCDLDESQRLKTLVELSFRHALLTAQKEFVQKGKIDAEICQTKGEDCCQKILSELEQQNLFEIATVSDGSTVNDSVTFASSQEFNVVIDKLEEESKAWSAMFESLSKEMTEEIKKPPETIHLENLEIINLDYSSIFQECASIYESVPNKVESLRNVNITFEKILELHKEFKTELKRDSERYFKIRRTSPRKLLLKISSQQRK